VKNIKMGDGDKIRELLRRIKKPISQGVGTVFSNIKKPYSYEFPELSSILKYGSNVLQGKIDEPTYGTKGTTPEETAARDWLLRSGFGMNEQKANRMGGKKSFIETGREDEKGRNIVQFNPADSFGKLAQREVDTDITNWLYNKLNLPQVGKEGEETYPATRFNVPVMSNYGENAPEFTGEGSDEGGYYNKVRLRDPWDFALNPGEKILNWFRPDKSAINLGRTILDKLMQPKTVESETKVYLPGIKKKPKRNKVSGTPLTGLYETEYD